MRAQRGRAKKLIVAFHFQFANQAAWRCDECRKLGLDLKRRCEWRHSAPAGPARPVWSRGKWTATTCPKSFIAAQSLCWIDEFYVWKVFGPADPANMPARQVEAFLVLEHELRAEHSHADEQHYE